MDLSLLQARRLQGYTSERQSSRRAFPEIKWSLGKDWYPFPECDPLLDTQTNTTASFSMGKR